MPLGYVLCKKEQRRAPQTQSIGAIVRHGAGAATHPAAGKRFSLWCSNFAEVESCTRNLNQNRSRNLYETASNFGIQAKALLNLAAKGIHIHPHATVKLGKTKWRNLQWP